MREDALKKKEGDILEERVCWYCKTPLAEGEVCPNCGMSKGGEGTFTHRLPPGTILNKRYLVGRVLGEGGFGITYIGCDLVLEMKVAIKEYYPVDRAGRNCTASLNVVQFSKVEDSSYETGKERFLYEAKTMARMNKLPQIVNVRDYFEANNTAYIIMEYVDGTNLKDLVTRRGKGMPAQELLPKLEPLFGALSQMHEQGLIHRDISPDNLMLENGRVCLIDFGCARESVSGANTMTITLKQGYAPIEQYKKDGQGTWTDVYAMAATIYFCLTGQVPPSSAERTTGDCLILPRRLGADMTATQEQALIQALQLMPQKRIQTMAAFHDALYKDTTVRLDPSQKETNQKEPEKPKGRTATGKNKKRKRKTWGIVLAVAAAVCVLALALALFLPKIGADDFEEDDFTESVERNSRSETTEETEEATEEATEAATEAPTEAPTEPTVTKASQELVGTVDGCVYTSPYAGFGCTLDDGWIISDAQELQDLPENTAVLLEDTAIGKYVGLYEQITDMSAENDTMLCIMNVLFQETPSGERLAALAMGEKSMMDALVEEQGETLAASYAQMGMDVVKMESIPVTFLGEERTALYTECLVQDMPVYMVQIMDYSRGKYSVVLTVGSYWENTTQELLDLFYPVE